MPVATLNYTGRERIKRADVRITLASRVFSVEFPNVHKYPADSLVFVEPYRRGHSRHISFGTAGAFLPPPENERTLSDFRPPESALFRVKIVSPDDAKILASGESIHPEGEVSLGKSMLPVQLADLGAECWRVSFSGGEIVLLIHERLAEQRDWRDIAKSDYFMAFVYPAVFRQVLCHILLVEKDNETEGDGYARWLRFGAKFAGANPPPCDNTDDVEEWITDAVSGFARAKTKSIDRGARMEL